MEQLETLSRRVLDQLEPDRTRQAFWTKRQELHAPSQSECVLDFEERLLLARELDEKVFVFGDYDADGILGTTILCLLLESLGLEYGYYIPDRIKEGYGLNENITRMAAEKGYGLLITVDNGVKAAPAIQLAKELDMDVIVTDHHTIEEEVPADLLVHPSCMEEPFSTLCGAGVAYELARAMKKDTDYMQMLAAVASIADVMRVTGETRAIIHQGLEKINANRDLHLERLCSLRGMNEEDVAFQIVPKLNAIGRMSHMARANNAVRYFLCPDLHGIERLSTQMLRVNDERKKLSAGMVARARELVNPTQEVLLIQDPGFHEGIIGLAAGSLCQEQGKAVIVATQGLDGIKASMRSPEGFDCMEFLKDFEKFQTCGGHRQAAGFSLDTADMEEFERYVWNRSRQYSWQKSEETLLEILPEDICLEQIRSLDALRPFGPGFECPRFELKNPPIKNFFDLQNKKHRKYTLINGAECMRFNQKPDEISRSVLQIESFVGSLRISEYQGRKTPSFVIDEIRYR